MSGCFLLDTWISTELGKGPIENWRDPLSPASCVLTPNNLILLYSLTVQEICLCPSFELGSGDQVCVSLCQPLKLVFILPPCVSVSLLFFLPFVSFFSL